MNDVSAHYVSTKTVVALIIFLIVYEYILLKRSAQSQIGLLDFCILSSIAVLPVSFAFFPSLILWTTNLLGVGFPFLLLIGFLFLIIFIFMFQAIHRLSKIEMKMIQFAQEEAIKHEQLMKNFNANTETPKQ